MQATLHLKSSSLLARSSSVSRNCSDLRTPNSRCSQSSHSRNTFQSRSGRKDFLPVEPPGGLSLLFLLSSPTASFRGSLCFASRSAKKYGTPYFSARKRTSKYSRSCSQSLADLLRL